MAKEDVIRRAAPAILRLIENVRAAEEREGSIPGSPSPAVGLAPGGESSRGRSAAGVASCADLPRVSEEVA